MKYLCALILPLFLLSCSGRSSLEGFWLNPEGKAIAEVTEGKIILTLFTQEDVEETTSEPSRIEPQESSGYQDAVAEVVVEVVEVEEATLESVYQSQNTERQLVGELESLDKDRYYLKGDAFGNSSPILTVHREEETITITMGDGSKETLKFIRPPHVTLEDLEGTWHNHYHEDDYEVSTIITFKGETYNLDSQVVNHSKNRYSESKDDDLKFDFKNGFMFVEEFEDEYERKSSYTYFIRTLEEKEIQYVDTEGDKWTDNRIKNPRHPRIPDGYREE